MVVDTSVEIAILSGEPTAERLTDILTNDSLRLMSAATLLECSIVIESRLGQAGVQKLDEFLAEAQISIDPVTVQQIGVARQAYRSYGKGRHPAALNFGDCFSYALAKTTGESLHFQGNDFSLTDVIQAS